MKLLRKAVLIISLFDLLVLPILHNHSILKNYQNAPLAYAQDPTELLCSGTSTNCTSSINACLIELDKLDGKNSQQIDTTVNCFKSACEKVKIKMSVIKVHQR